MVVSSKLIFDLPEYTHCNWSLTTSYERRKLPPFSTLRPRTVNMFFFCYCPTCREWDVFYLLFAAPADRIGISLRPTGCCMYFEPLFFKNDTIQLFICTSICCFVSEGLKFTIALTVEMMSSRRSRNFVTSIPLPFARRLHMRV